MRFFLYGTLSPGSGTRMGDWIGERLVAAARATVPGRLIAIRAATGWYPALLPARSGSRIRGLLADLRLGPGDLAFLDRYEGREYRRGTVLARIEHGGQGAAQAWRWHAAIPPGAQAIPGGDFLAWLAHTRNRPFSERRNGI